MRSVVANSETTAPSETSGESERPRTAYDVAVLGKALDVLEALAANPRQPLRVGELASRTGVSKASAFRVLSTLESRGYVVKDAETHRYMPGPRLIGLSAALVAGLDLVSVARPVLEDLKREFGETVNLGVLADGQVLYLDMLESHQGLRTTAHPGTRDPLHCTALGKAMLACMPLDDVRHTLKALSLQPRTARTLVTLQALERELAGIAARGYALDDGENEDGARCVGVAVCDAAGRPIAALSVSGPAGRLSDAVVARIGERLVRAAREVRARMGYLRDGGM